MSRRTSLRSAGTLVLIMTLVASGCGRHTSNDDATEPAAGSHREVCVVTEVVRDDILRRGSFAELVERPTGDRKLIAAASAIALVRTRYDGDLGPYQAAIDHLAQVGRVNAEEQGAPPEPDAKVRASARRLDRDLADGLCT
ncbi:MAG: hypothetical protein ACTHN0_17325 [Aquihabitans sp.]